MPIEDRNLQAGTRLVANYKKQTYVCTVARTADGRLSFTVEGIDRSFTSPSQAGSAVMGGTACNGWRFWSVEGAQPAAKEPGATREARPKAKAAKTAPKQKAARKARARTVKLFQPMEDGRFWCIACQDAFTAETRDPEACDRGHRADDPELTSAPAEEAVP